MAAAISLHLLELKKLVTCCWCNDLSKLATCPCCNHHFCLACINKFTATTGFTCPKCKLGAPRHQEQCFPDFDKLLAIYKGLELGFARLQPCCKETILDLNKQEQENTTKKDKGDHKNARDAVVFWNKSSPSVVTGKKKYASTGGEDPKEACSSERNSFVSLIQSSASVPKEKKEAVGDGAEDYNLRASKKKRKRRKLELCRDEPLTPKSKHAQLPCPISGGPKEHEESVLLGRKTGHEVLLENMDVNKEGLPVVSDGIEQSDVFCGRVDVNKKSLPVVADATLCPVDAPSVVIREKEAVAGDGIESPTEERNSDGGAVVSFNLRSAPAVTGQKEAAGDNAEDSSVCAPKKKRKHKKIGPYRDHAPIPTCVQLPCLIEHEENVLLMQKTHNLQSEVLLEETNANKESLPVVLDGPLHSHASPGKVKVNKQSLPVVSDRSLSPVNTLSLVKETPDSVEGRTEECSSERNPVVSLNQRSAQIILCLPAVADRSAVKGEVRVAADGVEDDNHHVSRKGRKRKKLAPCKGYLPTLEHVHLPCPISGVLKEHEETVLLSLKTCSLKSDMLLENMYLKKGSLPVVSDGPFQSEALSGNVDVNKKSLPTVADCTLCPVDAPSLVTGEKEAAAGEAVEGPRGECSSKGGAVVSLNPRSTSTVTEWKGDAEDGVEDATASASKKKRKHRKVVPYRGHPPMPRRVQLPCPFFGDGDEFKESVHLVQKTCPLQSGIFLEKMDENKESPQGATHGPLQSEGLPEKAFVNKESLPVVSECPFCPIDAPSASTGEEAATHNLVVGPMEERRSKRDLVVSSNQRSAAAVEGEIKATCDGLEDPNIPTSKKKRKRKRIALEKMDANKESSPVSADGAVEEEALPRKVDANKDSLPNLADNTVCPVDAPSAVTEENANGGTEGPTEECNCDNNPVGSWDQSSASAMRAGKMVVGAIVEDLNVCASKRERKRKKLAPCKDQLPMLKNVQMSCPTSGGIEEVEESVSLVQQTSFVQSEVFLEKVDVKTKILPVVSDGLLQSGAMLEKVDVTKGGFQVVSHGVLSVTNDCRIADYKTAMMVKHRLCLPCEDAQGNVVIGNVVGIMDEHDQIERILSKYDDDTGNQLPKGQAAKLEPALKSGGLSGWKAKQKKLALDQFSCIFCQVPNDSLVAGPMMHYEKGVPVKAGRKIKSLVSVHVKCAEWAPNVYYVGDTAKNLHKEVARGQKLKCSQCGLKGAVLGCFLRSCFKSFHYPCAQSLSCRWDPGNYVVLCPDHVAERLPSDELMAHSKNLEKGLKITSETMAHGCNKDDRSSQGNLSQNCALCIEQCKGGKPVVEAVKSEPKKTVKFSCVTWASSVACELVLCGSGLNSKAHELLASLVNRTGARLTETWDSQVTHLIVGTDGAGAAKRTLKFLLASLAGNWILKTEWLEACMAACQLVREEAFEVSLDIHGLVGGPKRARLLAASRTRKLLEGVQFYFLGEFAPAHKTDLQTLVSAAGGQVLGVLEDGWSLEQETPIRARFVVYNVGMMPGADGQEVIKKRWLEAKSMAYKVKAHVVAHTWLLDSIAAYELQPLRLLPG